MALMGPVFTIEHVLDVLDFYGFGSTQRKDFLDVLNICRNLRPKQHLLHVLDVSNENYKEAKLTFVSKNDIVFRDVVVTDIHEHGGDYWFVVNGRVVVMSRHAPVTLSFE